MDQLLYGIPVVGLVFQLAGYLIAIVPPIAPIILRSATPLALGAMCGVMCERSGIVNIGIEGTMLASAFTGWVVGIAVAPLFPAAGSFLFGITPALLIALLAALVIAVLISALHAWLSISLRADQIISGTIINIAAFGVTGYLNTIIAKSSPTSAGSFVALRPPADLTNLPLVGWILRMILNQGPLTMLVLVIVVVFQVLLFRSRWGLRTRAVGEHPKAAETVGIDVIRLRYRNVLVAGVLAGLAGAYLSMEATNSFQAGMTAGRGFIALAAMIFGNWRPFGAFGAALLFGFSTALAYRLPAYSGSAATLFQALPYVLTLIAVAGVIGRTVPPAADGKPYKKQ